jgi:starch phosphorylase
LTIGFARRFATYKRATLLLSDSDRLARLCGDSSRPVQFVFAGKAHPRDDSGKHLIRRIIELSGDARFSGRLVFVEDYDINVGRHLVQGVDVWLNTPQRPLEASGTSGQKAVLNGGLNLSILDGWWAEAYDGQNGFAVGDGVEHGDAGIQGRRDAAALYDALEQQIVPLFFEVDAAGLPRRWVRLMKHSIMSLGWRFNAARMVMDYVETCYLPAAGGLSRSMGSSC